MKLLNKTGLYNSILSLCIMAVGGIGFYFILLGFIDSDATEKLYTAQERVKHELPLIDSVPANSRILNDEIRFALLPTADSLPETISDTIIHESYDDEDVPYRVLTCSARTRLYNYKVTIRQSLIESNDLLTKMAIAVLVLLGLYLVLLFMINRFISRKLWQPFYDMLGQLKAFDIQGSSRVGSVAGQIDEFNALNEALVQMTEKIRLDYQNLKEFTENASHEIQTPLAIIRSKIELMLQSEATDEHQWKQLQAMNEAVTRLSRLNQSLLLLSKIDNGQFGQGQPIDLSAALRTQLSNLDELISSRRIKLYQEIEPDIQLAIHPYLLDILLGNILMNAIRHNVEGGLINIHLKKGMLSIQNSGKALAVDPALLFTRFRKGDADNESIGIGLSLVQKIAETNRLTLTYTCREQIHTLLVRF